MTRTKAPGPGSHIMNVEEHEAFASRNDQLIPCASRGSLPVVTSEFKHTTTILDCSAVDADTASEEEST